MTIREIIAFVNEIKPSAFSDAEKIVWLNEVESMVQTDVLLLATASLIQYADNEISNQTMAFPDAATVTFTVAPSFHVGGKLTISDLSIYKNNNVSGRVVRKISSDGLTYTFDAGTFADIGTTAESGTITFDDSETELLVSPPHQKIYYTYLMAMIDFANGEYDKYQNTMTLFNTFFENFVRWYIDTYRPGDGECEERGYYISAYAIAVKHGYVGTEEQWLASLQGDRAVSTQEAQAAAAAALTSATTSSTAADQAGESKLAAVVAKMAAEAAKTDAQTAKTAAQTAATTASSAALTASSAKDAAVAAQSGAQSAASALESAVQQTQSDATHADEAKDAAAAAAASALENATAAGAAKDQAAASAQAAAASAGYAGESELNAAAAKSGAIDAKETASSAAAAALTSATAAGENAAAAASSAAAAATSETNAASSAAASVVARTAAEAARSAAEAAEAAAEAAALVSYDDVPTEGSVKPVKSGGIYTALTEKVGNISSLPDISAMNSSDYFAEYSASDGKNTRNTILNLRYWLQSTFGSVFAAKTHAHTKSQITDMPTALSSFADDLGSAPVHTHNDKADLVNGVVPASQLPSYVDDVIEAANYAALPSTGESGKIYITIDDNKQWRWGGSSYAQVSESLALGETSATAYRGDRGKIAYDHSQTTGNPHGLTKSDLSLGNVENTADMDKPVSTASQTALAAKQDKTNNLTAGTTLSDDDAVPFYDSSASAHRKTLWSTIKSTLKAYFDTIYTNNGNLNNFKLGFGQVIINYGSIVVVGYSRLSAKKINNSTWLISGRSSYSRQAYTMEYGISLAQIGNILGLSLSGTNGLANMSVLKYWVKNDDATIEMLNGYGGCCELTNSNYYRPARYYNTSGGIGGWESTAIPEGAYIDFEIYATGS